MTWHLLALSRSTRSWWGKRLKRAGWFFGATRISPGSMTRLGGSDFSQVIAKWSRHCHLIQFLSFSFVCQLKEMFPKFSLCLPPKRRFKDNYDMNFLEQRQVGLQAFLQNLVTQKDMTNWYLRTWNYIISRFDRFQFQMVPPGGTARLKFYMRSLAFQMNKWKHTLCFFFCLSDVVRGFLCLDDPPGPFDSLEESKVWPFIPATLHFWSIFTSLLCCRYTARPWRKPIIDCRGSCRISNRKSSLLDGSWTTESSKSTGWKKTKSNGIWKKILKLFPLVLVLWLKSVFQKRICEGLSEVQDGCSENIMVCTDKELGTEAAETDDANNPDIRCSFFWISDYFPNSTFPHHPFRFLWARKICLHKHRK